MSDFELLKELSINSTLEKEIKNISNQIIQILNPISIYLFGSSVKNEMKQDSDLDWLIVIENQTESKRKISQLLYKKIKRELYPCDFIVTDSHQLEKQKSNIGLIYYYILKEGKCIYAR
jgi:predicted nucleotidyltransferase